MSDKKSVTFILVRGLPGSGKSYLAQRVASLLGEDKTVLLDPDAIDFESEAYRLHSIGQLSEGVDRKLLAYRYLRSKAYLGIEQGKIVIWNQPFTDLEIFQKMIQRLKDYADQADKQLDISVIEVNTPSAVAYQRVKDRIDNGGHGPSENTFRRFEREYSSASSLGYNVIELDGTADITQLAHQVATNIRN